MPEYYSPHSQERYNNDNNKNNKTHSYLYVLPVLLLEFLAIALTRAVLPSILLNHYGSQVYLVMGMADCVRGLLAFVACPIFGKISDIVGRKSCLLVTVIGTCAPVCCLALFAWIDPVEYYNTHTFGYDYDDNNRTSITEEGEEEPLANLQPDDSSSSMWEIGTTTSSGTGKNPLSHSAITTFIVLLSISGIFSSTFTLVFAYISDTVKQQDERVSAYGLALATFGLSFTIGPMLGGYLAKYNTHYVFICSLVLTILDVIYIYFILPESRPNTTDSNNNITTTSTHSTNSKSSKFLITSPYDTFRIVTVDPFLRNVGRVAFLYYTSLWAVISTLSVYAVQRFHLNTEQLGELMSALGACTMIAEAILVRLVVPALGEKASMKVGLIAFTLQCIVLALAFQSWHLFICVFFSIFGNLVYPSLSSLVSGSVEPALVGEALGAINGIKALTEGIGPLVFGTLMTISGKSILPGWPYLLAALFAYTAYIYTDELPDDAKTYDVNNEYIHELDRKRGVLSNNQDEDEYEGLLSEIEEDAEDDIYSNNDNNISMGSIPAGTNTSALMRQNQPQPIAFASLMKSPLMTSPPKATNNSLSLELGASVRSSSSSSSMYSSLTANANNNK